MSHEAPKHVELDDWRIRISKVSNYCSSIRSVCVAGQDQVVFLATGHLLTPSIPVLLAFYGIGAHTLSRRRSQRGSGFHPCSAIEVPFA